MYLFVISFFGGGYQHGGGFLVVVAVVALPLFLLLLKPPPGPPKPPGKLVRVEIFTRAISGGGSLIECRDYRNFQDFPINL